MAAPTPEEQKAWLTTNVAADLTYIWEAMGVTLERQYDLGQNYRSVALFAALAGTKQEARAALGRDLGIARQQMQGRGPHWPAWWQPGSRRWIPQRKSEA